MAPFAGYEMPIQYAQGILAEHLQTRASAGLFDVSHMGQARLDGPDHATTAARSNVCARLISSRSPPGGSAIRNFSTPTAASSTI